MASSDSKDFLLAELSKGAGSSADSVASGAAGSSSALELAFELALLAALFLLDERDNGAASSVSGSSVSGSSAEAWDFSLRALA